MATVTLLQPNVRWQHLGQVAYAETHARMLQFTHTRTADTLDEIWMLQHPPTITLGQAGKMEHVLTPTSELPIIRTDRGGQATYHGPGQLVIYTLLDLPRLKLGIRELIHALEQICIDCLAQFAIIATRRAGMPGVYVADAKIAALGLRVRKGCCYHGLALNVAMDLTPFANINPCGYRQLAVTQIQDLQPGISLAEVQTAMTEHLARRFHFSPNPNP